MAPKSPVVQGAIFFAIFFVAAVAFEATIFVAIEAIFNTRLVPRGLGWIVIPFSAGLAGWAFGQQVGVEGILRVTHVKTQTLLQVTQFRIWIAGSALWTVTILGVFLVFDPFDRYRISYWHEEDWLKFIAMLAAPPFVGLLSIGLFQWALNTNLKTISPNVDQSRQKYMPGEAMSRNIFWTMTALAVVNGKLSERKLHLIEQVHLQLLGTKLDRGVIAKMADSFIRNGPDRAKDLLERNRELMGINDREMLIKFCCLLLSQDKPISDKEHAFIYGIADSLEISHARLNNFESSYHS